MDLFSNIKRKNHIHTRDFHFFLSPFYLHSDSLGLFILIMEKKSREIPGCEIQPNNVTICVHHRLWDDKMLVAELIRLEKTKVHRCIQQFFIRRRKIQSKGAVEVKLEANHCKL